MARRKNFIQVPVGNAEKIANAMGCSRTSVFNALAYRSESENAKVIRKKALEEYGGVMTSKLILD